MRTQVQLERVFGNPFQTREEYGNLEELARVIAKEGVIQTPIGRPIDENHDVVEGLTEKGVVQLAFGHRRMRALEFLWEVWEDGSLESRLGVDGVHESLEPYRLPVRLNALSDEQMYQQAVIENEKRKSLDAIERARSIRIGKNRVGYSLEQLASLYDKSVGWVSNQTRLLRLPEKAQQYLRDGAISQRVATALVPAFDLKSKYPGAVGRIRQKAVKPLNIAKDAAENDLTSDEIRSRVKDLKVTLRAIQQAMGTETDALEPPESEGETPPPENHVSESATHNAGQPSESPVQQAISAARRGLESDAKEDLRSALREIIACLTDEGSTHVSATNSAETSQHEGT